MTTMIAQILLETTIKRKMLPCSSTNAALLALPEIYADEHLPVPLVHEKPSVHAIGTSQSTPVAGDVPAKVASIEQSSK